MDILKPEVVWVEGRCYRFNESSLWDSTEKKMEPYIEEDPENILEMSDEDDDQANDLIIKEINGKYKHCFFISNKFFGFIIGAKGITKKKLESETNTRIHVPNKGETKEELTIIGTSRDSVVSCRRRIDLLVESSRKKLRPTHFLSIPLHTNETIVERFIEFKSKVLSNPEAKSKGIIEDFFVEQNRLHITVGVFLLLDEREIKEAEECLKNCVVDVVEPILKKVNKPVVFKVEGVNIFKDRHDTKKTSILFANILPNKTLQELVDKTFIYFMEHGLMREEHGSKEVSLHMTLMKTSRLRDKKDWKIGRLPTFDATNLLEDYKKFEFGEATLNTLLISEMSTRDENGGYINKTRIDL